jgi:hypothetical protein
LRRPKRLLTRPVSIDLAVQDTFSESRRRAPLEYLRNPYSLSIGIRRCHSCLPCRRYKGSSRHFPGRSRTDRPSLPRKKRQILLGAGSSCQFRTAGNAIPCNGVLNSLISKKKSLIREKQFPANFAIPARRFGTTAGNCGVLSRMAARLAEIWAVSGQRYGCLGKDSLWLVWLFPGNARSKARDWALKLWRKQRMSARIPSLLPRQQRQRSETPRRFFSCPESSRKR